MKRALLLSLFLLAASAPAFAETHYAVVLYRSGGSAQMVLMATCGDKASCLSYVDAAADDDIWAPDRKGCLTWQMMSDDQRRMFQGQALSQPYIVFDDRQGRRSVVLFLGADAAAQDLLIGDRVDVLKSRGNVNVTLVADPGYARRKSRASEPPPSLSRAFGRPPAPAPVSSRPGPPAAPEMPPVGNLGLRVTSGSASGDPVTFRGEVTYYGADGERTRQSIEGEGNRNFPLEGRGIRVASVERTSDDGWVRLEVVEAGRTIFDGKSEDHGSVNYRAGR